MLWFILPISILILIDLIVYGYGIRIGLSIFESSLPFASRLGDEDRRVESFWFPSQDGQVLLKGSILTSGRQRPRGIVLFCHELGGNRWTARHYCEGLIDAGFTAVTFDFSNHGESERRAGYESVKWLTEYDVNDVLGAAEFVRTQTEWNGLPFFLFGVSKGAGAALSAAARMHPVAGVVAESAYSTRRLMSLHALRWLEYIVGRGARKWFPRWRIEFTLSMIRWFSERRHRCRYEDLEQDLTELRSTPILWISGGNDTYVKPSVTGELCEAAGGNPAADVWIVPGARHNSARMQAPGEYDRRVVEFMEQEGDLISDVIPRSSISVKAISTRTISSQHA